MAEIDIEHLRTWIGRRKRVEGVISRNPAAALAATLDRELLPEMGDPLPPLWHWVYFTPLTRRSELGRDGHPRLGGFMPPVPLPRRMWAGGRLKFLAPIRIGDTVSKETEITEVVRKDGGGGDLVFVTLRHRLETADGVAVEEEQDIVYRALGSAQPAPIQAGSPSAAARQDVLWRDVATPDPVLLMRYSALTFNAHRIHYDLPYACGEEGYSGLVVHGPLTATLLAERLSIHVPGRLTSFSFRGRRPLFASTPFHLCGTRRNGGFDLWAEVPGGPTAMSAEAAVEPD